jgi:hypothetical protein
MSQRRVHTMALPRGGRCWPGLGVAGILSFSLSLGRELLSPSPGPFFAEEARRER